MGLVTSHEQLGHLEPDPIVRVKRNHLLYDQQIVSDASRDNMASDSNRRPAKIVEYRTDMDSGQRSGRYRIKRLNQSDAHILTMRKGYQFSGNDGRKGCEKLLVGDCSDKKAPIADEPLQLQGIRVHRIVDMISFKPVESHEQLREIMSHLTGWVSKDYEYRVTSSFSMCNQRIRLPRPDLREESEEALESFVRTVNGVERRNVFEVWSWTLYHNPLYAAGRLSLVLPPRQLSYSGIIPDMCAQEMFAMEVRAHPHHRSTPGYPPRVD